METISNLKFNGHVAVVTVLCQNSGGAFPLRHCIHLPTGAGQPSWPADERLFIKKPPTIASLKEHIPPRLMREGADADEEEGCALFWKMSL